MRNWSTAAFLIAVVVFSLAPIAVVHANVPPPEPFVLGIAASRTAEGLRITSVQTGSHAANAGLKVGDVILGADARYTKSMSQSEVKQFVEGLHLWKADLVLVRDGRDIVIVNIHV